MSVQPFEITNLYNSIDNLYALINRNVNVSNKQMQDLRNDLGKHIVKIEALEEEIVEIKKQLAKCNTFKY